MTTVKTRFAPSPTGGLHVGNVRTALYTWLFAKIHQGLCYLRIEDTDNSRQQPEAAMPIMAAMKWLDITFDGVPVIQSERLASYRKIVDRWVSMGLAYRCNCSPVRLASVREAQMARQQKPKYDGKCRHCVIDPKLSHVIRWCQSSAGHTVWKDVNYGDISVKNSELDDCVLIRTDGMPTYNLACVIDDIAMGITHVIRGNDHLPNTARQLQLYAALQAEPPIWVHLPLLTNHEGKPLSKRDGTTDILGLKKEGILPDALVNYLARLGWSSPTEWLNRSDLFQHFNVKNLTRSPIRFDWDKLYWFNNKWLQQTSSEALQATIVSVYQHTLLPCIVPDAFFQLLTPRFSDLKNLTEDNLWGFQPIVLSSTIMKEFSIPAIDDFMQSLSVLPWSKDELSAFLMTWAKQHDVVFSKLANYIRLALTGALPSLPVSELMLSMVQTEVCARLTAAQKLIASS
jgi:glutamyl-tRNA synthetase